MAFGIEVVCMEACLTMDGGCGDKLACACAASTNVFIWIGFTCGWSLVVVQSTLDGRCVGMFVYF